MKYTALFAVIAILLLQFSGAVPDSSVGGPMTLALVFFGAAIAVGIHEAWSNRRGVLGWIVSIVTALIGGYLAAEIGNLVVELIFTLLYFLNLQVPLAATRLPLLYVSLAGMMLLMLLGSWVALRIVSRWR